MLLRTKTFLLDLFFPPRCGGCNAVGQGFLCANCLRLVKRYAAHTVKQPLAISPTRTIYAVAAASYTSPLREAIHAFKYEGEKSMAMTFGELMQTAWLQSGLQADAFVPVPLHPRRMRERGFNQSDELAKWAVPADINVLSHALARTRYTSQQAKLNIDERKQNVRGAFGAQAKLVLGKRVVIVDDVFTTGATIGECARALLECGAIEVNALTLTRA